MSFSSTLDHGDDHDEAGSQFKSADTPAPIRIASSVGRRTGLISSSIQPFTNNPTAIRHTNTHLSSSPSSVSPGIVSSHSSTTSTLHSTKNLEILNKFPEFRSLLRDYKTEQRKVQSWTNEYSCLLKRYQKLEQSSFRKSFSSSSME